MPKTFGSDVLVDCIKSMGIKYVSLNPGASTRGMHDSVVNYGGNKDPELILCCHEETAVALAAGYFRATGKPMIVLLHDLEGLFHATKAIYEAWLNRESVILVGGNGPLDVENRRPWIDWIHTALLPNSLVRDYVKWDDQPQGLASSIESLIKAYRVSLTDPKGPVYVCLDTDIQEKPAASRLRLPSANRYLPTTFGEGSLEVLEKVAELLLRSEMPVIIADQYGVDDASVTNLVQLAEQTGAAVVDTGVRFNFPTNHPLNFTMAREEVLSQTDLVLALDVKDLHFQTTSGVRNQSHLVKDLVRSDCDVIRIGLEGLGARSWVNDEGRLTPTKMELAANSPSAIARLLELSRKKLDSSKRRKLIAQRIVKLAKTNSAMKKEWTKEAQRRKNETPIALSSLALTTWELLGGVNWTLAFSGYTDAGISSWIRKLWDITSCYQYPGRTGGTGTGIGRALGVTLGNRDKLCIGFQPDGDLLYSTSALWTAAHYRLPLLIIMLNNRSYNNSEEHQEFIAGQRGRPMENRVLGTRIQDPEVDFANLALAYGITGLGPFSEMSGLSPAIKQGIEIVSKKHQPCLLDAIVQSA